MCWICLCATAVMCLPCPNFVGVCGIEPVLSNMKYDSNMK